jgi:hypothetical protein
MVSQFMILLFFASLRSSQGLHFFPRIFFLLFSLFHFYLFLYPFGFCYTALASTSLFMTHSMLFFWHRYELPAVAHGHVTLEHPRMGPHPMHQHHHRFLNDHDPPRSHPSPYGPTPPGIPNILLPARRTATPSLLRHPIHSSLPYSASRTHSTAPVALEAHHDAVVGAGGGVVGGDVIMSRPGSSVALVRDDDSTSSYMYFMDGEVVVHSSHNQHRSGESRPRMMNRSGSFPSQTRLQESRRHGPLPSGGGVAGDLGYDSNSNRRPLDRPYGAVDADDQDDGNYEDDEDASSSLRSVMGDASGILDDRSLREVLLDPPEPSRLRRRGLFVHSPADATIASARAPSNSSNEDAPEMSSLQAILFRGGDDDDHVEGTRAMPTAIDASTNATNHAVHGGIGVAPSSSTPRATNRSSASHEIEAPVAGAPPVPLLRNRHRNGGDREASDR